MDSATIAAVLLTIAGGAGTEVGSQLWDGLLALIRCPFRSKYQNSREGTMRALPTGEVELAALEDAPVDEQRALALAKVLLARASTDSGFSQALHAWWEQTSSLRTREGIVVNTISGGNQYGPVIQGHTFTGVTFTSSPETAAPSQGQDV
jgi:hypothetical protein